MKEKVVGDNVTADRTEWKKKRIAPTQYDI